MFVIRSFVVILSQGQNSHGNPLSLGALPTDRNPRGIARSWYKGPRNESSQAAETNTGTERPDDPAPWGAFFERYRTLALRSLRGRVADPDSVEDLFQEVARSMWEGISSGRLRFASAAHARNYLFRALTNRASTAHHRRANAPQVLSEDPADAHADPSAAVLNTEAEHLQARRARAVARAIERLRPEERRALHLRFREELTYAQMAARTGLAISTLQARTESALARLRGFLRKRNAGGVGGPGTLDSKRTDA